MMVMDLYPGFEGQFFSMPTRNVVPKPLQTPHPPIWVACSKRETIHMAARAGIGALNFAFINPADAVKRVDEYYDIINSEACVPIVHAVNANIAMVTGFSCHEDEEEAFARGAEGFQFFGFALGHHYIYGDQKPGPTYIWERFQAAKGSLPPMGPGANGGSGIGTPAQLRENLALFADAGIDQVIFIQQSGRNKYDHICAFLELFAKEVMPVIKAGEAERDIAKAAELAPYVEAALARKPRLAALSDDDIPTVYALGRQVAGTKKKAVEVAAPELPVRAIQSQMPRLAGQSHDINNQAGDIAVVKADMLKKPFKLAVRGQGLGPCVNMPGKTPQADRPCSNDRNHQPDQCLSSYPPKSDVIS